MMTIKSVYGTTVLIWILILQIKALSLGKYQIPM